jgi:predicted nucleic acid-binding protein
MSEVFGDTSFFVALISLRDKHHGAATKLGSLYRGRVVTTHWVVLEVANFFASSKRRAATTEFIETLLGEPDTVIVLATVAAFYDGWSAYRTRRDKAWSLTDCISFNVMRERGI